MVTQLNKFRFALRIWRSRKKGVQVGRDCVLIGMPCWGSEPYLISLGNHVRIAAKVTFITHDGGTWVFRHDVRCGKLIKYGRIVVHDNSFIGFGATILPGVEIGPDSVIGAGAVVTRSIPSKSVAAGNPARPIMTYDEYADRSLRRTPPYDEARYRSNKREELLRLFPYPW